MISTGFAKSIAHAWERLEEELGGLVPKALKRDWGVITEVHEVPWDLFQQDFLGRQNPPVVFFLGVRIQRLDVNVSGLFLAPEYGFDSSCDWRGWALGMSSYVSGDIEDVILASFKALRKAVKEIEGELTESVDFGLHGEEL